ncbi:glycosyltransferase [Parvularcula flava]|uniref:Glycosyl transferase n=1 Tax=Aquisalinus luteolus TaxID=1566827 RepID=A0A8J3A2E9_9PROT|nr:glycosyltransferase [Aquisalinus luteolus]NHK26907.1 glycosyltransferase [Aquisalinus luteolus]GGH93776.1 glycosyl transferase [Aquisalinus luteolus]
MTILSIIISNFNYAHFLPVAIDSVLSQADDEVELIVVDDVSSDHSREIIAGYGERITPVLHEVNKGHGGAFNSGFAASRGDLVMFLDADDFLLPGAIEAIRANVEQGVAIYHYRMLIADETGTLGDLFPPEQQSLASGDIASKLLKHGRYDGTITSGLVFSRAALAQVMPMDQEAFRQGGDGYLSAVVPLYGESRSIDRPLSGYRRHGANHSSFQSSLLKRTRWYLNHDAERHREIIRHARRLGLPVEDTISRHDKSHLESRLVSLLLAPESHPFAEDTRARVAGDALKAIPETALLRTKIGQRLWFVLLGYGPKPMARKLIMWKLEPDSRPTAVAKTGRFLRTRLGLMLR